MTKNRDIRLTRRPSGLPQGSDFDLVETDLPSPSPGQVLVRNLWMSVDPYMRGRMSDRRSYVPPYQIGEVLSGGAVGRIETGTDRFAKGEYVLSQNGWREWFVSDGADLIKLDPAIAPVQAYLGALGMPGLTAYVGLTRIGAIAPEDRVFISGAAGAVGSTAVQIARNLGCTNIVGSAGTAEKCDWIKSLGCRDAINYHDKEDLAAALEEEMPSGIDLYFENVGGRHMEAALANMRENGRIVICGLIDQYNSTEPPRAPRNLAMVLSRRLTMRGFLVFDHYDLRDRFLHDMKGWIAEGRMTWHETIVEGLERAPEALIGLFHGTNTGKMLVKLADDA